MRMRKEVILVVAVLLIILNVINVTVMFTLTGRATTATGTIGTCINHGPVITTIADQHTNHNIPFTVTATATDEDDETITFDDNSSMFVIAPLTGIITFTPNITHYGQHTIEIGGTDSAQCPTRLSGNFILNVLNRAPNLSLSIANQSWEEDVSLSGLNLSEYFIDQDNDTLYWNATTGGNVSIIVNNQDLAIFRPVKDFFGVTWVVFSANDTVNATSSNNITLTITEVENYCGDNICNSGESCATCSADCGSCPATGSSSGGGGGGGGSVRGKTKIIEIIPSATNKTICDQDIECGDWSTQTCFADVEQERVCVTVNESCSIIKSIQTRECECIPSWQCSLWSPASCFQEQVQQRTCEDVNHCEMHKNLSLRRVCPPEQVRAIGAEIGGQPLFGFAFRGITQKVFSSSSVRNGIGIFIILLVVSALVLLFGLLRKRRRRREEEMNENALCLLPLGPRRNKRRR